MKLFLKSTSTATLLLLLFALHPVHLQNTVTEAGPTDGPTHGAGKSVPPPWLRKPLKVLNTQPLENEDPSTDDSNGLQPLESDGPIDNSNGLQPLESDVPIDNSNGLQPLESDEPIHDSNGLQPQESDGPSVDDQSGSGIASGSMVFDEPTEDPTQPSIFQNDTMLELENQGGNVSTTTQSPLANNTSVTDADTQNNGTTLVNVEEIPQNSANATNVTEVQTTTQAPETNATEPSDVSSGEGITEKTTTLATPTPETTAQQSSTTSEVPVQETTKQQSSTTSEVPIQETTEQESPEPSTTGLPETNETTTSVPNTPDRGNLSDKGAALSGGTAERGFGSESERRQRKSAWGAVLGTFVAIAVVGLVAYVILKKKHHKAFSHRKLEEDFPSDPVLRLDNSEPLDLNFGRAAYYNPGLQGDNIQMSPYPKN